MNPNVDPDQITPGRTIYEASGWEIFWRNFIAGFARGLGNFIFSVIFLAIIANVMLQYFYPMLSPMLESFSSLTNMLDQVSSGGR